MGVVVRGAFAQVESFRGNCFGGKIVLGYFFGGNCPGGVVLEEFIQGPLSREKKSGG